MSHTVPEKPEPLPGDDEWLTIGQAIAYTKISRSTLYRLMDEGVVPYYRVSGTRQRRFKRSELDQLMIREEPSQSDYDEGEEDG